MNQEKLFINEHESSELATLQNLYEEIYDQGGMVRELSQGSGYLACVGSVEHFRKALGLGPDEKITHESLSELPTILLFAYPAVGETRVEAVKSAFRGWRAGKEAVETGRVLHGSFEIGGGEMRAYMPNGNTQKMEWTIEYILNDEVVFTSQVDMMHEPVFGPDASDVASLNERIEELIVQYSLES